MDNSKVKVYTVFMFQMLSWVLAALLFLSFYTESHKHEEDLKSSEQILPNWGFARGFHVSITGKKTDREHKGKV